MPDRSGPENANQLPKYISKHLDYTAFTSAASDYFAHMPSA